MSKERLESLKRNKEWTEATGEKFYTVDKKDYEWLIKQAELVGYFARKNGELNEFLNKYIEPKHLGKNVIDVAMDIIVKQAERVQELERANKQLERQAPGIELDLLNMELTDALKQIKRYREALENIVNSDGWLIELNPFCTIEEAYERCVDEAQKALESEK